MDFSWDERQRELYAQAVKLGASLPPPPDGHAIRVDPQAWRALADFGALGLCVPTELGGLGLGALTTARIVEGLGYSCKDRGLLFSAAAHLFACTMPIVERAPAALRDELVPRLVSGELIAGNAMTEPHAGSDTSKLETTATPTDAGYVLSGIKSYVTNGPMADVFVVYAMTDPKAGHLGTSAFVVLRDDPGVTVGTAFEKLGLRTSPIGTLYLEDCPVPAARRIGPEGAGARIFADSMGWERACLFAFYVGAMDKQLADCIEYARNRRQFGVPISGHQAVSHRLVDMKLRLEAARLLLYRACWLDEQGVDNVLDICLSKLAVSEAAVASGLDAIAVHGGLGYMAESGVGDALLDAIGGTIFSGTSDIQRKLAASRMGLR